MLLLGSEMRDIKSSITRSNKFSPHQSTGPRQLISQRRGQQHSSPGQTRYITCEHGDAYIEGRIQPHFDVLKARHFDSSWNWVHQDALLMWYDTTFNRRTTVDHEITAHCNFFPFKFAPIALHPTLCWLDVSSLLRVPPLLVG